uniref:Transport and golgi organization 6 homolog n=1 Tax=Anolis carolinensis TaxID=28377 RepID=H9G717_ANOCA
TGQGIFQETKGAALLESLRSSVASLEEKLAQDPRWDGLRRLTIEVSQKTPLLPQFSDVPWTFTRHVLLLLLSLKQSMVLLAAAPSPPQTPVSAPPLSPDTLSVAQEKTVRAALQFAVTLGLCPFLLPGVGLPLDRRTEFGAVIREVVSPGCLVNTMSKLYATCTGLLEVAQHPLLGSLVLTRHLGDLLAGLCQLGFCPGRRKREGGLTEEEQRSCREALGGLLDRVYQPLVVRELLILQGGSRQGCHSPGRESGHALAPAPSWLRRLCGQLLSERLLRPGGVQAVVRGILEGAGAGAMGGSSAEAAAADWQKCDAVARILSSCPQQSLSLEDYCQQVCPQVLQLFLFRDQLVARQFQRVATTAVLSMAREHPEQAQRHLLRPLLEPLQRCLEAEEMPLEDLPPRTVLVKEEELGSCVENVFKVYVVGNEPSNLLLNSLQGVLGVVFSLWCFTKQNVSFLRTPCQEILLWFLEKSERQEALSVLEGLAQMRRSSVRLPPLLCQFQVGSEGGVMAAVKADLSPDKDEDEALYQKVSSEQWRLEQLVGLLSHCQSSGLAGDFFLRCLKPVLHMSLWERNRREKTQSDALSRFKKSQNFYWVASLAVIQQMTLSSCFASLFVQVVEFVAATLQRASASLSGGSGATSVEDQTLSMAMGLVAAVMGGAVQLKSADFAALKRLVPLLEEVSHLHPEPVIQELAADLRITICTHGAFSAGTVSSAAQTTLGKRCAEAEAHTNREPSEKPESDIAASRLLPPPKATENRSASPKDTPCSAVDFQELLLSAYDPDIPTRAATLRTLSRLIKQRDPEALKTQETLLKVFTENLEHEDSFVYLSAIQGMALLSDAFPDRVLPCLLAQYGSPQPGAPKAATVETRMKVGEALMRVTRRLGDMVFLHREDLIHAFLRGAKDPEAALRASSLSNLGELCQILRFQLGLVVHEVTSCLTSIVKTDREVEVRRAAVHVVVLLLRGLSEEALEVLRDVVLDLYRLLKSVVRHEEDGATVLHAQLALEELDGIMRRLLFPPQALEKKIQVLP